MPLVKGDPGDTAAEPTGRIRNAKKLLTTAALIMSVMLMGSADRHHLPHPARPSSSPAAKPTAAPWPTSPTRTSATASALPTTSPPSASSGSPESSAMAGLLNIVPRYLPRYGMAPDWARATRPLVLVFTFISVVVTIAFDADVDAQAGAYATGVLALMTSAAVAVTLTEWRRGHRGAAAFFGVVAAVFVYTITVTILDRPEGLVIALVFIAMIVVISLVSRISRSTELRVQKVTFDTRRPGPARRGARQERAGAVHRQQDPGRRPRRVPREVPRRAPRQPPRHRGDGRVPRGRGQRRQRLLHPPSRSPPPASATTGSCGPPAPASPTCWLLSCWRSATRTTCPPTSTSSGPRRGPERTRCGSCSPARATSRR